MGTSPSRPLRLFLLCYHFPPMADTDPRVIPVTSTSGTVWRRYFGSSHAGGLNAVLADGSVRFISFTVDPLVFMRACVADDGAAIPGSF